MWAAVSANQAEFRDCLVTRRTELSPQQTAAQPLRRHPARPGLRREEVALLAGVSVDYYTRLERGNLTGFAELSRRDRPRAAPRRSRTCPPRSTWPRRTGRLARGARSKSRTVRPTVQLILDGWPARRRSSATRPGHPRRGPLGRALFAPGVRRRRSADEPPPIHVPRPAPPPTSTPTGTPPTTFCRAFAHRAGSDPDDRTLPDLVGNSPPAA